MEWWRYIDYSLYAAIICMLIGYAAFPMLRTRYTVGQYTVVSAIWIFGITLIAFIVSFFGPILLAGGKDTVLPLFASVFIAPLGAFIGLVAFLINAFSDR